MTETKKSEPVESWFTLPDDDGPEPCPTCDGTGVNVGRKCKECDGKGHYESEV